jgi:hypothetical protein
METFDKKMAHFYDKDKKYYTMGLKSVLKNGLSSI